MARRGISEATLTAVAEGMREGKNNTEIARAHGVSEATVRNYKRLLRGGIDAGVKRLVKDDQQGPPRDTVMEVTAGLVVDNVRARVARVVALHSPIADVEALAALVRRPGEDIPFVAFPATLWSLQKQGEVTFVQHHRDTTPGRQHGAGPSGSLTRIRALPALYDRLGIEPPHKGSRRTWPPTVPGAAPVHKVGKDYTDASAHGATATGGPVEHRRQVDRPIPEPGLVTPAPDDATHPVGVDLTDHHNHEDEAVEVPKVLDFVPGTYTLTESEAAPPAPIEVRYPVLAALREKRVAKTEAEQRAEVYMQAAAMIEAVDTMEAVRLSARAEEIAADFVLTSAEAEYLRFADEHPDE